MINIRNFENDVIHNLKNILGYAFSCEDNKPYYIIKVSPENYKEAKQVIPESYNGDEIRLEVVFKSYLR